MSAQLLTSLAEHGVLGVLMGIALWALAKQARKLSEVEESRTKDAQAVVQTLLTLSDKWNGSIQEMKAATEQQQIAITAVERTLQMLVHARGG